MKLVVTLMVVAAIVVATLIISSISIISPAELTRTRFKIIEMRIIQHIDSGKDLNGLDSLRQVYGKDNSTFDGWGTPIHVSICGKTVLLHSYGKDRKPDLSGQGDDLYHHFHLPIRYDSCE